MTVLVCCYTPQSAAQLFNDIIYVCQGASSIYFVYYLST